MSLIRDITDTARWAAIYRARETERPDAVFKDPFARRLAGERGDEIARSMPDSEKNAWAWIARTWVFDRFIMDEVRDGADMIINLAAGFDARPYRMSLPRTLHWVEVDLPEIFDYKEKVLAGDKPICNLERVRMNLADVVARRELFSKLGRRCRKALIITEGLLIYLAPDEVATLGRDLAAVPAFRRWIVDLASPLLLKILSKGLGPKLAPAGISFKFGPPEGKEFFEPLGWKAIAVRGHLKTGAKLKRLPFFFKLMALLPDPKGPPGRRPWGGVCLLNRE